MTSSYNADALYGEHQQHIHWLSKVVIESSIEKEILIKISRPIEKTTLVQIHVRINIANFYFVLRGVSSGITKTTCLHWKRHQGYLLQAGASPGAVGLRELFHEFLWIFMKHLCMCFQYNNYTTRNVCVCTDSIAFGTSVDVCGGQIAFQITMMRFVYLNMDFRRNKP